MSGKWENNNKGFLNWVTTGKPSFLLESNAENVSKTGNGQLRYDSYEKAPWASLIKLSRGKMRLRLSDLQAFLALYAQTEAVKQMMLTGPQQVAFGIRAFFLGIGQVLDFVIYLPLMLLGAIQLALELVYERTGKAMGFFEGESKNRFIQLFAFFGFIFSWMGATACRALRFLLKPSADGAAFVINVLNILPAAAVGGATAGIKYYYEWRGERSDLKPYHQILQGTYVDMVYPFSAKMGKSLQKHFMQNGSQPLPSDIKTMMMQSFTWSHVIAYAFGFATLGFLASYQPGFNMIDRPMLQWIAHEITQAMNGSSALNALLTCIVSASIFQYVNAAISNVDEYSEISHKNGKGVRNMLPQYSSANNMRHRDDVYTSPPPSPSSSSSAKPTDDDARSTYTQYSMK